MDSERRFWLACLDEMKRGYAKDDAADGYRCLVCDEFAEAGRVYPIEDRWYDAEAYMKRHVSAAHRSMFHYLLGLDKKWTGLTDAQRDVLERLYEGGTDAETASALGAKPGTVRYHRFHLREKEKQAKVFLALMALLEERPKRSSEPSPFVPIHRTAPAVDERYAMTEDEYERILDAYFPYGRLGPLKSLPVKEKRKLAVLRHLAGRFERNRRYTEKEINDVLKEAYSDYATVRRHLIDYGFLDREDDGSRYWVKGERPI